GTSSPPGGSQPSELGGLERTASRHAVRKKDDQTTCAPAGGSIRTLETGLDVGTAADGDTLESCERRTAIADAPDWKDLDRIRVVRDESALIVGGKTSDEFTGSVAHPSPRPLHRRAGVDDEMHADAGTRRRGNGGGGTHPNDYMRLTAGTRQRFVLE